MEPPPYDTPFVHLTHGSNIHQFIWKKYFDTIGMKYYAIGPFENNQQIWARMNLPDNCKIMQFEGFTWPWTSGSEEWPLSE
jgi:hypothetical protein